MSASSVTVRRARSEDRDRLLDLKCAVWPHLLRSNELTRWTWEFDRNPAYDPQHPTTLVVEDAGEPVGMFNLIPHRVQLGDALGLGCDGVDLCVAGSHRGQGLSTLLVERWMSAESCDLAFTSTPSDVAVHVLKKCGGLLLGSDGEPMAWAHFMQGDNQPAPSEPYDTVQPVDHVSDEADRLWERVRGEHKLTLVKDAAYFEWRYCEFPFTRPVVLEARDATGQLTGLAAVQTDQANNRMYLCDLVAEGRSVGAHNALIRAAIEHTRAAGMHILYAATHHPALVARLQSFSFRAAPGGYPRFMARVNVASPVAATDWSTALGDGDQLYNVGEPTA